MPIYQHRIISYFILNITLLEMVFFKNLVNEYYKLIFFKRMEFKMKNHELFEKIEAKEKEWEAQVKYLKAKAANFDPETRVKIETQIDKLNMRLKEIEKQTNALKKISNSVQHDLGDQIIHSWIESFTKIDDAMLKLNKLNL